MALEIHQKWRGGDRACAEILRAVYKQTVEGETEQNKKKTKMASAKNQNRLCGLIIRSNCCYDSYSTTRRVRLNIFCSMNPSMLSAIVVVVMRHRRGGAIVSSIRKVCRFSTMRPGFKEVHLQALRSI